MGIVAAKLLEHYKAEAKERMLSGKPVDPMDCGPQGKKGAARDKAGAAVGVSGKSASPQILLWKIYHNKKVNRDRRHLSPSQLAAVGAKLRGIYDQEAKERQRASGGDHAKKAVKENLPEPLHDKGQSRDQAAKAVGVSGKSIDHATKVHRKGTPALQEAVDSDMTAGTIKGPRECDWTGCHDGSEETRSTGFPIIDCGQSPGIAIPAKG